MDIHDDLSVREPRKYELAFHLLPTLSDAGQKKAYEAIQAIVLKHKGLVFDEATPELMDLAYPMHAIIKNKRTQFDRGYFGWLRFDVAPTETDSLIREIESQDEVLRVLCISIEARAIRQRDKDKEEAEERAREDQMPEEDATEADTAELKESDVPQENEALKEDASDAVDNT